MVKKVKLDFSKVEERSGWNTRQMPEGLHEFKVAGVEDKEASDGTDMWVFALVPVSSKYATRRFPYYCKLQENQLWKVRDLLIAAGVSVPKRATLIDPTKAVGKIVAGEVTDATGQYEGRSEINGIYGLDALEGSDEDEPEDDEDEEYDEEAEDEVDEEVEEEDEEVEEEDYESMTLPELRKLAKSLGVDTAGLKKAELIESIQEEQDEEEDEDEDDLDDEDLEDEDLEDEEFEDDEEEEEEEEPAPKRRSAAASKKTPAKPAAKAAPAKRVVRRR